MGGDLLALGLALEELARVDSSVAITLEAAVALGAMPIYRFGTDEQRRRWLPELCAGERLAAFGLTEAGGGTDIPGGMRTTARLDAGEWVIDGSKSFITNAGTSITALVTVLAITGETGLEGGRGGPGRSRPSWCRPGPRASRSAPSTPRSAGARRIPANSPSRPAGCPRSTCSGRAAAAMPSSWRSWTRAGSPLPHWPPGWPRAAWTSACGTWASGPRSASRSASSRPPSSRSPTWRPGRTRPGWPGTTRPPGWWPGTGQAAGGDGQAGRVQRGDG